MRLFTFGCSFTKYKWPTWADIIGTNFPIHYNYGELGAGNYYISLKLYEIHLANKITSNDVVIIMLSSSNRFDFYDSNIKKFNCNGNVYNSENVLGEHFVNNIWNVEHSIYNTWFMVKTIKTLLDSIGCKYKIIEGFGLLQTDEETKFKYDTRIEHLITDYQEIVYTKESLQSFMKKYKPGTYKLPNGEYDGHATIMCNHDFVKKHLSEFYTPKMKSIAENWETEIIENVFEYNSSFRKIKLNPTLLI